jgi:uncharacterized protein YjbI with pentapeptide repeats
MRISTTTLQNLTKPRAIEQLGNSKLEIRFSGIYALERIARDSKKDHWSIMEGLTAYIRQHAQRKEKTNLVAPLATDIQAILTVIRRREWSYEKKGQNLDLHRTDLHGANLMDVHLEDADLTEADLTDAVLGDAHLERAVLTNAVLRGAYLNGANLDRAVLSGAILRSAVLIDTILTNAVLRSADLEHAVLTNAVLIAAVLRSATLRDAYLRGTNLRGAKEVTQEQIDSAIGNATTRLPTGIVMPESWKRPDLLKLT